MTKAARISAAAMAASAALLLTACGSSGSGSSNASGGGRALSPGAALVRAADVTGGSQGYRVSYSMQELAPVGRISVLGSGTIGLKPTRTSQMTMTLSAAQIKTPVQLQEVQSAGTIYVKLPSQLSSHLPGGRAWLKMTPAEIARYSKLPGLSSLLQSSDQSEQPTEVLNYLKRAGQVTRVGSATVNGVATTEYQADMTLAQMAAAAPAGDQSAIQSLLSQASKYLKSSQKVPLSVWIDSAHLVRRMTYAMTVTAPGQSGSAKVNFTLNFLGYGAQPNPSIPSSSQTLDLSTLVQMEGGAGSGA